jgi:hypothetical protein
MKCFGTTDFDNNSRLITLSAIIISGLHCIYIYIYIYIYICVCVCVCVCVCERNEVSLNLKVFSVTIQRSAVPWSWSNCRLSNRNISGCGKPGKGQRCLLNIGLGRFWNWFGGFGAEKTSVAATMNGNPDRSGTILTTLSGFPRYRIITFDGYLIMMARCIKEKKTSGLLDIHCENNTWSYTYIYIYIYIYSYIQTSYFLSCICL